MLKTTLDNEQGLIDIFREFGREDSFSLKGFKALFEYLEEISEEMGEDIEINPVDLDGEFIEYEDLEEYQKNEDEEVESMAEVENNEVVIPLGENPEEDGFIIRK